MLQSLTLVSKVGGFLGMGRSVCESQITFDKNQYYLGETVTVRIVSDNTKSRKDIEKYQFKL